jgi:hypothetical protein
MTHSLKAPGFNHLNLSSDLLVSKSAFQMQLVPLHTGLAELFSAQGAIFTKGVDEFKDLKNVQK